MSEKLPIDTYPVSVNYFVREADGKGGLCETPKSSVINLCRLSRTSAAHTKLGVKMLYASGDLEESMDIAKEFVRLTATEEKIAEAICEDMVACLDVLNAKPVQEDIGRFLSTWGFLKKMEKENPDNGK